jgi:hypothetical protein
LLPFDNRHTKLAGQPEVEQSPGWHLLSFPQLPLEQSEGLLHAAFVELGGDVESVSLQR